MSIFFVAGQIAVYIVIAYVFFKWLYKNKSNFRFSKTYQKKQNNNS